MWLQLLLISFASHGLNSPATIGTAKLPRPEICGQVLIRIPDLLGDIAATEILALCHDPSFAVAVSAGCNDDGCALVSAARNHLKPLMYSPRGTPGSWLCHALGGQTEMVFLGPVGTENKLQVCRKGTDLASVDYLLARMPAPKAGVAKSKKK